MEVSATGCLSLKRNGDVPFGMSMMEVALWHVGIQGGVKNIREDILELLHTVLQHTTWYVVWTGSLAFIVLESGLFILTKNKHKPVQR